MVLTMRIVNTKESSMSNYVNDYKVSDQIARSCVFENLSVFREEVYELAFGDDAVNKDYSDKEVLEKLFQNLQSLQQYVNHFGEMFGEER
tara:strand:- start:705 stop:974 length:270 start_codon:yes stop_codon:yes gene_type:complete